MTSKKNKRKFQELFGNAPPKNLTPEQEKREQEIWSEMLAKAEQGKPVVWPIEKKEE